MQLEMNLAWNDAVRLLNRSRDVILVVAGVFFFLPYFAFMLIGPDPMAGINPAQPLGTQEAIARMMQFYSEVWWVIALVAILQAIGVLGLLALLTDRRRPTVGEALKTGLAKVLPYIAAYLMLGMALAFAVLVLASLAGVTGAAWLAGLVVFAAMIAWVVLFVRFSLVGPVMVKENVARPWTALGRSWTLTSGNGWRLFAFYALLFVAIFVITIVVSAVFRLGFGLFGPEASRAGDALIVSVINAGSATIFLAVLSAVHDQFARPSRAALDETFE
jgi:hypothetical protein